MRRLAAIAFCLAAACATVATTPAPAADTARSWALPEIKRVTSQGIFNGTAASFRPEDPLTKQALAHALSKLTGATETKLADGAKPVTLEQLDAALVRALGLGDAAHRIYLGARAAGLAPPRRFGTEAIARLLGLRLNHPDGQDILELQPHQIATRAEAAYSIAQILAFGDRGDWASSRSRSTSSATPRDFSQTWEVERAKTAALAFELPALTPWQRRILGTAVSYIGFPYIWGGTGEGTPGFDCSGFVWRVFKLTSYPDETSLAAVLRGRTTMQMSGEVARWKRIGRQRLEPGDVLFFGDGPRSKPAQVDHTGIYLGNDWFIHSSRYGVAVASLDGWYSDSFAWARRPLAEAGLSSSG